MSAGPDKIWVVFNTQKTVVVDFVHTTPPTKEEGGDRDHWTAYLRSSPELEALIEAAMNRAEVLTQKRCFNASEAGNTSYRLDSAALALARKETPNGDE